MAFSPSSPSAAKGHELATWVKAQTTAILATSQANSDVITDIFALEATLQTVIDSVGS